MQTSQKTEWQLLQEKLADKFGMEPDLHNIIFLIGVQELGMGYKKFKKNEKIDVMHVAICTLLEPYGYYEFTGRDADGWPHFKIKEQLPFLKPAEQNNLMIRAVLEYFKKNSF
jgi:calcineurin-like phosphoesterase